MPAIIRQLRWRGQQVYQSEVLAQIKRDRQRTVTMHCLEVTQLPVFFILPSHGNGRGQEEMWRTGSSLLLQIQSHVLTQWYLITKRNVSSLVSLVHERHGMSEMSM